MVDGTGLENRHTRKGIGGSNPSPPLLLGKNDWPRYTEEEPEIYEQEELNKLFAKCDPEERLWCEFFLMTGMREQEVMFR